MDAHIVGWGHTSFGRLDDSLEELISKAATEAIDHANLDPKDIDGIWIGHYNGGLVPDGFISSLALKIRHIWTHVILCSTPLNKLFR